MDNQRLFLYLGLGFLCMLVWQQWQIDYVQPTTPVVQNQDGSTSAVVADSEAGALPSVQPQADTPSLGDATSSAASVDVKTDVFEMTLSSQGADLSRIGLVQYPISLEESDKLVFLVGQTDVRYMGIQTGLQTSQGSAPNHLSIFNIADANLDMQEGSDSLEVAATWSEGGVDVVKKWHFTRGTYDYRVSFEVTNNSGTEWMGWQYRQLQRSAVDDSEKSMGMATFTGGVISTPEKAYDKISLDDIAEEPLKSTVVGGWTAMIEHYFANAIVPNQAETNTFYSRYWAEKGRYILGMTSEPVTLQPGQQHTFETQFYVGPKVQDKMEALAPHLRLTVDYGYLTFIAQPLFWLLNKIHGVVNNWGWAIILLTLCVKLLFYKLSEMGSLKWLSLKSVMVMTVKPWAAPRWISTKKRK